MTDAEYTKQLLDRCTPEARAHLEYGRSDEMRALCARVLYGAPSAADSIAFITWELREADAVLTPAAPANGRAVDTFHASCCVERALSEVRRLEKALTRPT